MTTVAANETEFAIVLSRSAYAAGSYVFVVHNRGTTTHALGISGPGVDATTDDVAPGAAATLTVTLRAGSYDIYCPVGNHKMLGMDVRIAVS